MNPTISLQEENKKALMYTSIICAVLIVLLFLIRWNLTAPAQTVIQDRIEIDLGNEQNGWGDDPPMVKGKPTPESNPDPASQSGGAATAATDDLSNDPDAATQVRSYKNNKPNENVGESEQTNRRPKLTYTGTNKGPNGNNDETDNGFTSQGKTPGAIGDEGSTNGQPKVIAVTRSMLKNYQFEDELGSEKIYARIRVSAKGVGQFVKLEKKSTSFDVKYKNAIINCLPKINFEGGSSEYDAVIIFDFRVN
jgi:hypothetical protein